MKIVIIIAIAFVLFLVPITAYATEHYTSPACVGCNIDDDRAAAQDKLDELISVSVWTDKTEYGHNDMIIVTGLVSEVSGFPITISVASPLNSTVTIDSLTVADDGSFETTLNTAGALWKYDGTYTIKVNYGSAEKSNTTKVELTGGVAYTPSYSTPDTAKSEPESELPSGDWKQRYYEVLSTVEELQRENQELKTQIFDLEKIIDNLHAVVMEQIKVIYDWVLNK